MFFIETIIFYLLLIDSLFAGAAAWCGLGERWYVKNARTLSRLFPLVKGWTAYYIILVLWIGSLLYRAGGLP